MNDTAFPIRRLQVIVSVYLLIDFLLVVLPLRTTDWLFLLSYGYLSTHGSSAVVVLTLLGWTMLGRTVVSLIAFAIAFGVMLQIVPSDSSANLMLCSQAIGQTGLTLLLCRFVVQPLTLRAPQQNFNIKALMLWTALAAIVLVAARYLGRGWNWVEDSMFMEIVIFASAYAFLNSVVCVLTFRMFRSPRLKLRIGWLAAIAGVTILPVLILAWLYDDFEATTVLMCLSYFIVQIITLLATLWFLPGLPAAPGGVQRPFGPLKSTS